MTMMLGYTLSPYMKISWALTTPIFVSVSFILIYSIFIQYFHVHITTRCCLNLHCFADDVKK